MRREELVDCLLASLVELEQAGDLVITHPNPAALADRLCDSVIGTWSTEFLDEPPFEVVIENGLSSAALHLQKHFDVQRDDARHLVESFIEHIGSNRTKSAVAEFISHQGAAEVAEGAYFCIQLRRGEYYGTAYLDWRKQFYAERKAK